jgi:hypothetical protein
MRCFLWCLLSILIFAGLAAVSEADNSGQSGQSGVGTTSSRASDTTSPALTPTAPTITVTGSVPPTEHPLPTLPPTEFTDCMKDSGVP